MPSLTAAAGLAVTYRRQYRRCGSPRCRRCTKGAPGHGPYWYAFWTEGGRTRSRYLGKDCPPDAGDDVARSGGGTAPPAPRPDERGHHAATARAPDGRGEPEPPATQTHAAPGIAVEEQWQGMPTRPPGASTGAAGAAPPLRVRTLGGFAVWRGEELLPDGRWARGKVGALFKLLLSTSRHTLPAEQAIERLWPEAEPRQGAANLRSTIRFLRAVLDGPAEGPSYLRSSGATLALDPAPTSSPPDGWLDAATFARRARSALAGTDRAACRATLALYGGAYLLDDPYEDWAEATRTHLAQMHERLLQHLARLAEQEGDAAEANWALRAVLASDPCQEEAAQALMRALLREGRQAEALRVYRGLARALREELDVAPSPRTEALRAGIRHPAPPSDVEVATPNNLPAAMTGFVGREAELAALEHALLRGQGGGAGPGARLLTLVGVGGIGKTRLALALAAAALPAYPDGVWLVELAPLPPSRSLDPTPITRAAATALGVREQPGRPLLDTLVSSLREKRLLLVLDNCEHLVGACAALAARLLAGCQGVQILVTSREALGMAGETLWPVPPLALPPTGDHTPAPADLGRVEAVALFVAQAQAARPGFTLTEANAPSVVIICHGLDGLPLAIELAAARLHALAVEEVATRLGDRFRLLRRGNRAALPRHQTLQAALDWSWDLLGEQEQLLLRRLSVFAGGWTLAAAEAVCAGAGDGIEVDEVLDLLAELVSKSLVRMEADSGGEARYRLLETVRQYAGNRLSESGDQTGVRDRHLAWGVALAEAAAARRLQEREVWLATLDREYDNVRAALRWAHERRAGEPGLRLAGSLWRFWERRGYFSEGYRWLDVALSDGAEASAAVRATAIQGAAMMAYHLGDYDRAAPLLEESLAIRRALGDAPGIAGSLNNLALLAARRGDHQRAEALHAESLAIRRDLGDALGVSVALNNLGLLASRQGDFARAIALHEESLAIKRAHGDKPGIAASLSNLGGVAYALGDNARAAALFEESLALSRELGDTPQIALRLFDLAGPLGALGHFERAAALLEESLSRTRALGDKNALACVLDNQGVLAARQGDYARAASHLEEGLALRRDLGEKRTIAWSLIDLGYVVYAQHEYGRAEAMFRECLRLGHEIGAKDTEAESLEGLTWIAVAYGQWRRAARLGGAAEGLRAVAGLPLLSERQADHDAALQTVRAALDEQAFAAAWTEGQALPLPEAVALALEGHVEMAQGQ